MPAAWERTNKRPALGSVRRSVIHGMSIKVRIAARPGNETRELGACFSIRSHPESRSPFQTPDRTGEHPVCHDMHL